MFFIVIIWLVGWLVVKQQQKINDIYVIGVMMMMVCNEMFCSSKRNKLKRKNALCKVP